MLCNICLCVTHDMSIHPHKRSAKELHPKGGLGSRAPLQGGVEAAIPIWRSRHRTGRLQDDLTPLRQAGKRTLRCAPLSNCWFGVRETWHVLSALGQALAYGASPGVPGDLLSLRVVTPC